ncbi:hypothetical protein [Rothia nasimurium]|uniref:hypothetical protein n=1 Tax=Rothia nasimurium TaxID=85336 RepID=UPI001F15F71E|nr:hypothetical protein [Rothia nasimurium]
MDTLDLLFRDFEAQLDAQKQLDYEADAQELRQLELSRIAMSDRLAAQVGKLVTVAWRYDEVWRGKLVDLGMGWLRLKVDSGQIIVPLAEILWWEGGDQKSYSDTGDVARKLTLNSVLRALVKGRRRIRIDHSGNSGHSTEGVIVAVGADYCQVSIDVVDPATGRRSLSLREVSLLNIAAVRID